MRTQVSFHYSPQRYILKNNCNGVETSLGNDSYICNKIDKFVCSNSVQAQAKLSPETKPIGGSTTPLIGGPNIEQLRVKAGEVNDCVLAKILFKSLYL